MPCYKPLRAWYTGSKNPVTGKRGLSFSKPVDSAFIFMPVSIPCGQCSGCRLERSRQWAMRCLHESRLHSSNCFVTLTFDEQNLPLNGSLDARHIQLFMKSLRERLSRGVTSLERVPKQAQAAPAARESYKVRFYACGEYGESGNRPHYHIVLFGFGFPDRRRFGGSASQPTYRSPFLESLWPVGHSLIADMTFETAAYVARYVMKKFTGRGSEDAYTVYDDERDEIVKLKPEFSQMSLRPGIGKGWYESHRGEIYQARGSQCVLRGMEVRPPVAYDRWLEIDDPVAFERLKRQRVARVRSVRLSPDSSPERLDVRWRVQVAKQKFYARRKLEDGNSVV